MNRPLRLTRARKTLDYYISWFSLHLACRNLDASQLLIAASETNFLARDVMRHAACGYSKARSRSTPLVNVPTMPDGVHNDGVLRFEDFEDDAV